MTVRVVGAGVGRTGTTSLKLALEQLLDAPCYHMTELFSHPEHVALWQQAVDGGEPWAELFDGYGAVVDWPVASFYAELSAAFPDALVLLSTRDADGWWRSAHATIFDLDRARGDPNLEPWLRMLLGLFSTRFTDRIDDEAASKAAYERHNAAVRASVPADRLLEWRPGDGWEPLCAALGVAVPDAPFPHVNTTEQFRAMFQSEG